MASVTHSKHSWGRYATWIGTRRATGGIASASTSWERRNLGKSSHLICNMSHMNIAYGSTSTCVYRSVMPSPYLMTCTHPVCYTLKIFKYIWYTLVYMVADLDIICYVVGVFLNMLVSWFNNFQWPCYGNQLVFPYLAGSHYWWISTYGEHYRVRYRTSMEPVVSWNMYNKDARTTNASHTKPCNDTST